MKRPSPPIGAPWTIVLPAAARLVVSVNGTASVLPFIVTSTGRGATVVRSPLWVSVAGKIVGSANVPATPAATKLRGATAVRSNCA